MVRVSPLATADSVELGASHPDRRTAAIAVRDAAATKQPIAPVEDNPVTNYPSDTERAGKDGAVPWDTLPPRSPTFKASVPRWPPPRRARPLSALSSVAAAL